MQRQVWCGIAAAVLVAGCGGGDSLDGRFCAPNAHFSFNGNGTFTISEPGMSDEGAGRYDYAADTGDLTLHLEGQEIPASVRNDQIHIFNETGARC